MRVGGLLVLVVSATPAFADPRLEAGAFVGVDSFRDDIALGNSEQPEQRPQTSPKVGGRLTYVFVRTGRDVRFDLGGEAELAFTPSWTGYGFADERPSYFAPILGYRADVIARFGGGFLQPHILGGAGGATVFSSSPYMKQDTEALLFWGAGATLPLVDRWRLRFDARQVRMDARDGNTTFAYELDVALGIALGTRPPKLSTHEHVDIVVDKPAPPPPTVDRDTDNDGIPDALDQCPTEAEVVNGIDDGDGCPEPDPDHDNLIGDADKCPDAAEDFDKFEDDDGCPDLDNDKDGVADGKDACPNEPETKNGIADDDGCADQIPPAITKALVTATATIKFDAGKVRLKTDTKAALDGVIPVLLKNRGVKVVIIAHADGDTGLAKKRAEAIRFYLNEGGVAAANLSVSVVVTKGPVIELSVGGI